MILGLFEAHLPVSNLNKSIEFYSKLGLEEKYYNSLVAPAGKQLLWMEKSSHMFHPDDAREIENILLNILNPKGML
ncbi:hypothetical protein J41TS4_13490 [Paenibacillus apis]|uniref:Uncharacterized protein n=1 Tax=Paenibacillus apis TaxID=1792174 RepID=A0A920CIG5_9BACL|nr:hypothetical protein J41TS4_13490 [Paenibacillus apis]